MKLSWLLVGAALLRILLILYAEYHDATNLLKYTDVDYRVFTDAARYIVEGESPYTRLTYRYTPLLAFVLQGNILLHPAFGKVLFCLGDLLIGILVHSLLSPSSPSRALLGAALWLFNPISAGVSTRGNAESLLGCTVLACLAAARQGQPALAGLFLSLSVHLKIYPILYSLPLFLYLAYSAPRSTGRFISPHTAKFVVVFGVVQVVLLGLCYGLYGQPFLQETYLYHLTRSDTRHNFSPYFYLLYLTKHSPSSSLPLLAFLPQTILSLAFSLRLYTRPGLCMTVQTIAFVMLNKVSTSQYFLWYLWLLPVSGVKCSPATAAFLGLAWLAGQGLWLATGYQVEFLAENAFLNMHFAALTFLLVQCAIVCKLIRS